MHNHHFLFGQIECTVFFHLICRPLFWYFFGVSHEFYTCRQAFDEILHTLALHGVLVVRGTEGTCWLNICSNWSSSTTDQLEQPMPIHDADGTGNCYLVSCKQNMLNGI